MEAWEEYVTCNNAACVIFELSSQDWYAIMQVIERAYYDGIMRVAHGPVIHNGTTGALEDAKAYAHRKAVAQ